MAVAEDAVVEVFFLQTFLQIDDDTLAVVTQVMQHIALGMLALIAITPAVSNTESKT